MIETETDLSDSESNTEIENVEDMDTSNLASVFHKELEGNQTLLDESKIATPNQSVLSPGKSLYSQVLSKKIKSETTNTPETKGNYRTSTFPTHNQTQLNSSVNQSVVLSKQTPSKYSNSSKYTPSQQLAQQLINIKTPKIALNSPQLNNVTTRKNQKKQTGLSIFQNWIHFHKKP